MQIHDGIRAGSIRMGLRLRAVSRFLENCGEIRKTSAEAWLWPWRRCSEPLTLPEARGIAAPTSRSESRSHAYLRVLRSALCINITALFLYITALINHAFIFFSAVQIYDLSYIHLLSSSFTGILRTHNCDYVPVALIAQLVEHCTSIAESRSGIFFQALTVVINHGLIGLHTFLRSLMYDLLHAYLFVWESLFVFPIVYLSLS